MKKRLLSLALALALAVALLPQAAQAASYVEVVPPMYDYIGPLSDGLMRFVQLDRDSDGNTDHYAGKQGYLDRNGKEVIPLKSDFTTDFDPLEAGIFLAPLTSLRVWRCFPLMEKRALSTKLVRK